VQKLGRRELEQFNFGSENEGNEISRQKTGHLGFKKPGASNAAHAFELIQRVSVTRRLHVGSVRADREKLGPTFKLTCLQRSAAMLKAHFQSTRGMIGRRKTPWTGDHEPLMASALKDLVQPRMNANARE
jgi:hypothetical protein